MDVEQPITTPMTNSVGDGSKNILIIVLLAILILSLLGINLFSIIGNWLQYIINIFNPAVSKGISNLEYASGTLLGDSSTILSNTSKAGIDILDGTVKSVGGLLLQASGQTKTPVPNTQPPTMAPTPPVPNDTTSPIQTNTAAPAKSNWCLVGEYNGTRGCVSISDQDKCLSGQVFPSQQLCLNPNLTQK